MNESSLPQPDVTPSFHSRRRRVLLVVVLLLFLAAVAAGVRQHPSVLALFKSLPSLPMTILKGAEEKKEEDEERGVEEEEGTPPNIDLVAVVALSSEETTAGKFRSGGLGLSRTAWEVLHGVPESTSLDILTYQSNAYKVTYQNNMVWQIEKAWGTTTPAPPQARTRIRRYLPLDSHHSETISKSTEMIVDVYRSHMLAQLLNPQPPEPPTKKKSKRRAKNLPTESCIVVHRLDKQKVISTLLHIGAPKPEGYVPPQTQTTPPPTTTVATRKSPVRNEARKEPIPAGKSKVQRKS